MPAVSLQPASANAPTGSKPRVVLSPEARQALAQAIWSAIRSPDGSVAPDAMARALATGLPQHAILNAARVAREREAAKRKGMEQQKSRLSRLLKLRLLFANDKYSNSNNVLYQSQLLLVWYPRLVLRLLLPPLLR